MAKRGRISHRKSKRAFSHGAMRVHPFNMGSGGLGHGYVMRGGTRL